MKISGSNVQILCEGIKNRFPYTSPWELRQIKISQLRKTLDSESDAFIRQRITDELQVLRDEYEQKRAFANFANTSCARFIDKPVQYYRSLIESIDFFKTIWCGAAAKLMYMICRMNGVEESDVGRSFVVLDDGMSRFEKELLGDKYIPQRLDHVVNTLITQDGIVEADPLFGKTYKEGEMHKDFERNYREAFNLSQGANIKICSEKDFPKKFCDMPHLNEEQKRQLSKIYPDLLI